jgi:hypothetical protein
MPLLLFFCNFYFYFLLIFYILYRESANFDLLVIKFVDLYLYHFNEPGFQGKANDITE